MVRAARRSRREVESIVETILPAARLNVVIMGIFDVFLCAVKKTKRKVSRTPKNRDQEVNV